MPDEFNEELIEELQPVEQAGVDPEEALDISDAALEDADATLLIEPEPQPLGQTIAWDFERGERHGTTGHGPHMVRGEATLRQWIEKCIRTAAGAHPIHPDGYGMAIPLGEFIGLGLADFEVGELEETIRDALLFHPAIKDVKDFDANFEEEDIGGDAALALSFTVVRDDDTALQVDTQIAADAQLEVV